MLAALMFGTAIVAMQPQTDTTSLRMEPGARYSFKTQRLVAIGEQVVERSNGWMHLTLEEGDRRVLAVTIDPGERELAAAESARAAEDAGWARLEFVLNDHDAVASLRNWEEVAEVLAAEQRERYDTLFEEGKLDAAYHAAALASIPRALSTEARVLAAYQNRVLAYLGGYGLELPEGESQTQEVSVPSQWGGIPVSEARTLRMTDDPATQGVIEFTITTTQDSEERAEAEIAWAEEIGLPQSKQSREWIRSGRLEEQLRLDYDVEMGVIVQAFNQRRISVPGQPSVLQQWGCRLEEPREAAAYHTVLRLAPEQRCSVRVRSMTRAGERVMQEQGVWMHLTLLSEAEGERVLEVLLLSGRGAAELSPEDSLEAIKRRPDLSDRLELVLDADCSVIGLRNWREISERKLAEARAQRDSAVETGQADAATAERIYQIVAERTDSEPEVLRIYERAVTSYLFGYGLVLVEGRKSTITRDSIPGIGGVEVPTTRTLELSDDPETETIEYTLVAEFDRERLAEARLAMNERLGRADGEEAERRIRETDVTDTTRWSYDQERGLIVRAWQERRVEMPGETQILERWEWEVVGDISGR